MSSIGHTRIYTSLTDVTEEQARTDEQHITLLISTDRIKRP